MENAHDWRQRSEKATRCRPRLAGGRAVEIEAFHVYGAGSLTLATESFDCAEGLGIVQYSFSAGADHVVLGVWVVVEAYFKDGGYSTGVG